MATPTGWSPFARFAAAKAAPGAAVDTDAATATPVPSDQGSGGLGPTYGLTPLNVPDLAGPVTAGTGQGLFAPSGSVGLGRGKGPRVGPQSGGFRIPPVTSPQGIFGPAVPPEVGGRPPAEGVAAGSSATFGGPQPAGPPNAFGPAASSPVAGSGEVGGRPPAEPVTAAGGQRPEHGEMLEAMRQQAAAMQWMTDQFQQLQEQLRIGRE